MWWNRFGSKYFQNIGCRKIKYLQSTSPRARFVYETLYVLLGIPLVLETRTQKIIGSKTTPQTISKKGVCSMFFGGSFQPFFGRPGRLNSVQFLRCGDNSEERDGSTQMRFNRLSNWTLVECKMLVTVMARDIGIVVRHASFLPWFHKCLRVSRVRSPSAQSFTGSLQLGRWTVGSSKVRQNGFRGESQKYRLNNAQHWFSGPSRDIPPRGPPNVRRIFVWIHFF